MINVSNAFKQQLYDDKRRYLGYADITLKDETVLHLTNEHIWTDGLSIDDAVSGDNSFDIGSAIINKCTLTINNCYDDFSEYDFTDAEGMIYVGLELPDGSVEKIRKGVFGVYEAKYNGMLITLSCLDNMRKFDRPYSDSLLEYPATLNQIVRDACSVCGVPLQTYNFPHDNFIVQTRPNDEAITFREIISWCAQIACCFCRCDTLGRLELKWYDQTVLEKRGLDGGYFDTGNLGIYESGDNADGGSFYPWNTGDVADGGTFDDLKNIHHIYSTYSMDISTDDVVITGVRVLEKKREEDKNDIVIYQSGTDGYVVSIENNELIQDGAGQTISGWIGEQLIGFRFRKANIVHVSDPTMEAGDVGFLTDRKQNMYPIIFSSTKFSIGNSQTTSSSAETPARNSATRYSAQTKIYVDYRREIKKERTEREKALKDLKDRVDSSSGLFTTEVTQPDKSTIFYMHDKPTLGESMIVWKMTAEAIAVSTDGGKTYNAGLTVDGDTIVRILTAVGVNADWVKSGALRIEKNGKVMVNMDFENKRVDMVVDSFALSSGETIDSIALEKATDKLEDFVNAVYDPKIASLQSQIDGQIETWYYDYQPTLNNIPASNWKTEADRAKHEGDLFYWKSKGYSYRFFKESSTWKWQLITDSDITKALSEASKAQDTADNKRRVFISTPTPPYDAGDLWFAGTASDILTCIASRASGNYASSDWQKRNKYIDQTAANTAASNAVNNQTQEDIFNKLTNNGKIKGIYMQNGELYMNATYINTGELSASRIKGGTLMLGGINNANGFMQVLDSTGKVVAQIDNLGGTFNNGIFNGELTSKSGGITTRIKDGKVRVAYSDDIYSEWEGASVSGQPGSTISTVGEGSSFRIRANGENQAIFGWQPNVSGSPVNYGGRCLYFPTGLYSANNSFISALYFATGSNNNGYINGTRSTIVAHTNFNAQGTLSCSGTKSRIVETEDYRERLLYCYEMASPIFGDIGSGILDESGECLVEIDDIFSETVDISMEYHVFLQKEGRGDIWVSRKDTQFFIVEGTPGLHFSWEIKARQFDSSLVRLDLTAEEEDDPLDYEMLYWNELEESKRRIGELIYEDLE
ncbi:MAG: hypothetical protein K1W22_12210 [Lachnospiraceae bacterium]